jgi:hypothetical protein
MLFFKNLIAGIIGAAVMTLPAAAQYYGKYYNNNKIRGHVPEWLEIESDVGSIFRIDMKSIQHPFGTDPNARGSGADRYNPIGIRVDMVDVIVLGPDDDLFEFRFTCHGKVITFFPSTSTNIAPRSMMGAIERAVCKDKQY